MTWTNFIARESARRAGAFAGRGIVAEAERARRADQQRNFVGARQETELEASDGEVEDKFTELKSPYTEDEFQRQ